VPEFRPQNGVDDIPVVREKNQAGRVLIQAADRKDPLPMADFRDDVTEYVGLAGRRDADRLVVLDIDRRGAPLNDVSVPGDNIGGTDLIPKMRKTSVDRDMPGLDQAIGLAAGADSVLREKLIDADPLSTVPSAE
jgi:hypothetical protein